MDRDEPWAHLAAFLQFYADKEMPKKDEEEKPDEDDSS